MGYRQSIRFLIFSTLIFSLGAFGVGHLVSCATVDEPDTVAGVQPDPVPVVAPDCAVQPLTEDGSEACTSTIVSPGDNSPNTLALYTKVTGFGSADGITLFLSLVTNVPGLVSGEHTIAITQEGIRNQIVHRRFPDGTCPDEFPHEGVRQNNNPILNEDDHEGIIAETLIEDTFVAIELMLGCEFSDLITQADIDACLASNPNVHTAFWAVWNIFKSHMHKHLQDAIVAGDYIDETFEPWTYEEVSTCMFAAMTQGTLDLSFLNQIENQFIRLLL